MFILAVGLPHCGVCRTGQFRQQVLQVYRWRGTRIPGWLCLAFEDSSHSSDSVVQPVSDTLYLFDVSSIPFVLSMTSYNVMESFWLFV